jgi:hypothetical protein
MPYKAKAAIIVPAAGRTLAVCSSLRGSQTATTKANAPTKSAITLGAYLNLSSSTGPTTYPDVLAGLNAPVLQVNANGGTQGHTVKSVTCDTQTNSNTELACARAIMASMSMDRFRCCTSGIYQFGHYQEGMA